MPNVLINKKSGIMAVIRDDGKLGKKGPALLESPDIEVQEVTEQRANHVKFKHCIYLNGNIILLPETDWPENKVDIYEDPEEG